MRVLVVEDSAVTREYLVYLLEEDPDLEVVGTAADGIEAVEQAAQLKPDVILMDVHMPRLNGYEAARRIMEQTPTPIVIASASLDRGETTMSFEAIRAGALTMVQKPAGFDHPHAVQTGRQLVQTLKLMAEVKVVRRWPRSESPAPPEPAVPRPPQRLRPVAIGASTGGPAVLVEILGALPADLAVPILVVQHITAGFTPGLVTWLQEGTRLRVRLAEAGDALNAGTVYLAPDGWQMGVSPDYRIYLDGDRAGYSFCPSVSYLFGSLAATLGPSALGVVLTGMGQDGASGLLALRKSGGMTIAQDAQSSTVFGMPGAAIKLGAAQYVLAPDAIAQTIRTLAFESKGGER